jgi:hypothetical protein
MAHYRIYFLNDAGHIALSDWIAAASDEEAIKTVRNLTHNHHKCEIWDERRLVVTLNSQGGYESP